MNFFRTGNLLDMETVQNTTIGFFGQGSLGSLALSLLAYPWKKILLIDPGKLKPENVERHLLGNSSVGQFKVDETKKWLVDRGIDPNRIETLTDMSRELEILAQANIIVVSIDDPEPCYMINQLSVNLNIPAVYGGVYPMGTAGQVVVLPNPKEICYCCAEKLTGALDYKGRPANGDYGVDPMTLMNREGKLTAVPCLKYSINAVASDMAAAVMDILSGTAEPEILIHAQTWEGILNLRPGPSLKQVSGMVSAQSSIGLVPNMKLSAEGSSFMLSIKQGKLALSLKRWEVCPSHGGLTSPDEI